MITNYDQNWKTGDSVFMVYQEYPGKWGYKQVTWIAKTTGDEHVIEEATVHNADAHKNMRLWLYVFKGEESAAAYAQKRMDETEYIPKT
jgi:hypothetical protein